MTVDEVISTLKHIKTAVYTDDLKTTLRVAREHEAIDFAIEMLEMLERQQSAYRLRKWCDRCGKAIDSGDRYCRYCGDKKVKWDG